MNLSWIFSALFLPFASIHLVLYQFHDDELKFFHIHDEEPKFFQVHDDELDKFRHM